MVQLDGPRARSLAAPGQHADGQPVGSRRAVTAVSTPLWFAPKNAGPDAKTPMDVEIVSGADRPAV